MNKEVTLGKVKQFALVTAMFVIGYSSVQAQARDTLIVMGKVVNGVNEPVSKVSVAVEGAFEMPSVTNESGEFTLKTTSGYAWLNVEPAEEI